jgi:uncharacterized SAM-binding protein YcdF (DUF218 family)
MHYSVGDPVGIGRRGETVSLSVVPAAFVVPPVNLLLLSLAGLALVRRHRRAGLILAAIGGVGLFVLALPLTGKALLASLETGLPLAPDPVAPPEAIVVLSADGFREGGPDQRYNVGELTLDRLRGGAALYRRVKLPILVAGGVLQNAPKPISVEMARSLEQDFGVPVRWIERRSQDTWENATESAAILKASGVSSIYLVTHAWHMKRALLSFSRAGITAVAAPVGFVPWPTGELSDFVPAASAWQKSYYGLHEWIGYIEYVAFRR